MSAPDCPPQNPLPGNRKLAEPQLEPEPYPNAPDGVGAPVTYPFLSIARKCISVYTLFLQISGAQPFPKWKSLPTGLNRGCNYRAIPRSAQPIQGVPASSAPTANRSP